MVLVLYGIAAGLLVIGCTLRLLLRRGAAHDGWLSASGVAALAVALAFPVAGCALALQVWQAASRDGMLRTNGLAAVVIGITGFFVGYWVFRGFFPKHKAQK